ncbi:MAG: bifunctional nuclease family protein [Candidatus Aenigmarchaeota archaeon]|nr:bifunctional nuclease family protein [Candidatus Aenigmarchaeota archaeon]
MMHWNISFNTIRLFSNGKSFKSYAIIIIVSLLLISFIFNVYMMLSIKPEFPLPLASGDMNKKLSLDGFEEVKIDVSPGFITMESECHRLIATTDISQSEAISMGIKKAMGIRPLMHDIVSQLSENFNMSVSMLKIYSIRNGMYLSDIVLKQKEKILIMDIRPSDGVAVAVRTGSPVYVNTTLMEDGEKIC